MSGDCFSELYSLSSGVLPSLGCLARAGHSRSLAPG